LYSAFVFGTFPLTFPFSLWINTMNRWIATFLFPVALAAQAQVGSDAPGAAAVQPLAQPGQAPAVGVVTRRAPADVKPARLVVTQPPQVTLNGQPDRLSPGARIRGTNNMMLLSGSVAGQTLPVVYRRDPMGLVHEVWVLTEEEYGKVAGADDGSPDGHKRFAELLNLVFGLRR
jgi:hypothetical protein